MIVPVLSHQALLADIRAAADETDKLHLWWLGQSGFLVQWQQRHLLLDPYLSDSLTKKYAATDKPHVRMTELVVDPAKLDMIAVVTSSHNHTDHLDGETLVPLLQANRDLAVVVPAANREFAAERLHVPPERLIGIDDGVTIEAAGFALHGVPAAHETVERDALGRCRFLGIIAQCGGWTIYHSGDTIRFDGMAESLSRWNIDVAILPINGRAAERRVAGNLWGREAAQLAHDIGAGVVIPCHYEMFAFNTAPPDEFAAACDALGQAFRVAKCGERITLPA